MDEEGNESARVQQEAAQVAGSSERRDAML